MGSRNQAGVYHTNRPEFVRPKKMNNAESVRQFQPRVALGQPWEKRISFFEGATLKELRRRLLTTKPRNPFRVAKNLLGHF